MAGERHAGRWRRSGYRGFLAPLIAVAAVAILPASASAASCPVVPGNATAWLGGSGSIHNDANWTNGTPSGTCDVSIAAAGSYTVTMTGGVNVKSLVLGGPGSTPHLVISDESPNTNLDAQPAGITIASGASVTLTCQPGGCPGGGPDIYSGASPFSNAGTITVDSNTGTGAVVGGQITNTGTMAFERTASLGGQVVNKSLLAIGDGVVVTNSGSSCGDTGVSVKNDTGGTIAATGTGTLNLINYEQGNGSTTGANPVQLPCGSVKYTGNGTSKVRAYGGFNLTGEIQSNQSLTVSAESSNTNAVLQGNFTNKGSVTLTCPASPGNCNGGSGGGAGFNVNDKDFVNAGAFTVAADSGTGASVGANFEGTIVNTGTLKFDQTAFLGGPVTNKGPLEIATAKVVTSSGSSCGDTGASVKNDTGGSINATGTGTLSVINYEQGAGTTIGTTPVQLPCGTLKYTGNGASTVQANGGFTLTGEMQAGQNLIVSAASSNTNANLGGNFTNKGSITLTCPGGGCSGGSGGGAGFNVNDKDFVNAGAFTVAAASGTGAGVGANFEGTIVNTGTMQFDQSGGLGGPVTNKGLISIANGKTATSNTSSCGDTGGSVKNDTGGQISAAGTGTLSAVNYEQGAGTTSGVAPVSVNCGYLKYTGTGASTVRVASSASLTGNFAAGQTVKVPGTLHSAPFGNAGTIALEGGTVNTSTLTNSGRLTGVGTVTGSVDNQSGAVAPGASPGTLTVNGSYTQGAGGSLEIEIAGTGAGQFDKLVVAGNATLGGTLALDLVDGYADSAAIGDRVSFLTYGGTRTNPFATTTVTPSLTCPKQIGASYDDGGKAVKAVVSSSGSSCGSGGGGGGGGGSTTPPPPVPDTKLGSKPKAVVKTKKAKASVSFSFSATVAGATFQCKLDKGAFAACKSPKAYKVRPGKHKFQVRAVGPGGTDATPASFSFKVVKKKG
jgi:fibronectin-binding autotransporter adhesin